MIINTGGRTDTVQYYTRWLLKRFEEGYVLSRNPLFQHKVTRYELTPDQVDCVVFCSKNYAPILPHINSITERFHTYFHYTIRPTERKLNRVFPALMRAWPRWQNFRKLSEQTASHGGMTRYC